MILESIQIENIRSIKSLDLTLPPSSMLFYGDVGSGKSSILKAIEFALFGTLTHADLSGESILRRGEIKAKVKLTFTIDSKRYTIIRGLSKNRGGKISQITGTFIDHGASTEIKYAPTDLRRIILKLLSYSITRYEKAQKLPLFRYTVYTPQEQVKEIILADPEDRFEILKEVFGIEKYESALKNIEFIKDNLNNQIKEMLGRLKQIGNPKELIPEKQKLIKEIEENLKKLGEKLREKEKLIVQEEQIGEVIQDKYNDYIKKLTELKNQEQIVRKNEERKKKINGSLEKLKLQISEAETELNNLIEVKLSTDLTKKQIKVQIGKRRTDKAEKIKVKAIVGKKINDIDKLLKEGKCALCGQAIHEKKRFEEEQTRANEEIEKFTKEINDTEELINELDLYLNNIQEFKLFNTKRKSLSDIITERKKREFELNSTLTELEERIGKASSEIKSTLKRYKISNITDLNLLGGKIKEDLNQQKMKLDGLRTSKLSDLKREMVIVQEENEKPEKNDKELDKNLKKEKSLAEYEDIQKAMITPINYKRGDFEDDDGASVDRVIAAGVSAYVVDGLNAKRVKPIVDVAVARFREYQALRDELALAKDSLEERRDIDRAKTLLIKRQGMSEDAAHQALRKLAMDQGKKLGEVARNVIAIMDILN